MNRKSQSAHASLAQCSLNGTHISTGQWCHQAPQPLPIPRQPEDSSNLNTDSSKVIPVSETLPSPLSAASSDITISEAQLLLSQDYPLSSQSSTGDRDCNSGCHDLPLHPLLTSLKGLTTPGEINSNEGDVYRLDGCCVVSQGGYRLGVVGGTEGGNGIRVGVDSGDGEDVRETWDKKIDFLLSIIGFAVDLANVWRFPYLCYKNGGGAFLIPYFLTLIFGAIPLFFMELVLGQFHRKGAVAVWAKISPIFKGIGICQCIIAFYVAFYYNVIIAWSMFYLVSSLTSTLPWTTCGNSWNTANCTEDGGLTTRGENVSEGGSVTYPSATGGQYYNESSIHVALSILAGKEGKGGFVSTWNGTSSSAAAEYFERGVLGLHLSSGLEAIGQPRWRLVLCLMSVFVIIYLSLWKGIKSSGKVVWVTATMPYAVLSILLVRGITLPGASTGILYYITPDVSRLADPQIWIDAAVQIFYSVGAGFGVHIAFASYNKFNSNCYRDCLATICVNSFTSLFSGFVIFSYLGYMSVRQNKDINKVVAEAMICMLYWKGPGLVFVVYPEAIATLPGSVGWSIIFFIMLLTLGIDSAMGGLEAVLTGLSDEWKTQIHRHRFGREIITACVVGMAFLFALPNVTNGGMYLVQMWDSFAAGTAILVGVFVQAVAIGWFYGIEQFCKDIQLMLGFWPSLYWRVCWKFISPLFILTIIVWSLASFRPLVYQTYTVGFYTYPAWANAVGWIIASSSMICIPITAVYIYTRFSGSVRQRIALCISPAWEHRAIQDGGRVRRFELRHWTTL